MESNFTGKNLIFLISQPRAGSTMLQKILGSHSAIYTVSEPWLMLHPLYALKKRGYQAEYNAQWSQKAVDSFLNLFPQKEQVYIDAIAESYGKLYKKALAQTDKKIFLDKTPRYYNVIPELASAFPDANFIVLLRNPIAVLCSIVNTWIVRDQQRWFRMFDLKRDILDAPQLLLRGVNLLRYKEKFALVHYEELLQNPEQEIQNLCEKSSFNYDPDILKANKTDSERWQFGDKKDPYKSSQPNSKNVDSWKKTLNSPQIWRLASEYLDFLGAETIQQMGYDYNDMRQYLDKYRFYYRLALINTLSLEEILNKPNNYLSAEYRRYRIKIINKLEKKGIWNVFAELPEKIEKK